MHLTGSSPNARSWPCPKPASVSCSMSAGLSYLSRSPGQLGLHLALTGGRLDAADALLCGSGRPPRALRAASRHAGRAGALPGRKRSRGLSGRSRDPAGPRPVSRANAIGSTGVMPQTPWKKSSPALRGAPEPEARAAGGRDRRQRADSPQGNASITCVMPAISGSRPASSGNSAFRGPSPGCRISLKAFAPPLSTRTAAPHGGHGAWKTFTAPTCCATSHRTRDELGLD